LGQISKDAMLGFRDDLRQARAKAYANSEGFQSILFVVERLGSALISKAGTLGSYKGKISKLVEPSAIACRIPSKPEFRFLFTPFYILYELVSESRNDALHQGAYARHLTNHCVELSLILEDALTMTIEAATVADFMIKNTIYAELWHPLAYVRQIMLANSFSYLPFRFSKNKSKDDEQFYLISDQDLAKVLRGSRSDRNNMLGMTLEKAIDESHIDLSPAKAILCSDCVESIYKESDSKFFVVMRNLKDINSAVGIVTPFDIL